MQEEKPDFTGTARWMLAIFWILLLVLLYFAFHESILREHNPNQHVSGTTLPDGTKSIELKRNSNHHYVVNGLINGQSVTFFVDTGATTVAIPGKLAKRLKLKTNSNGFAETAAGTVPIKFATINELKIGNIVLYNVRASISTHMKSSYILLGMSALKDLEFTQRGDTLILKQHGYR